MNVIVPPRDTFRQGHLIGDRHITNTFSYLTQLKKHYDWRQKRTHKHGVQHITILEETITETIQNPNHITLNTNTPTRLPVGPHQQLISQDISAIDSSLLRLTIWKIETKQHADHMPISTAFNTKMHYKIHQLPKHTQTTAKQTVKTLKNKVEQTLTNTTKHRRTRRK